MFGSWVAQSYAFAIDILRKVGVEVAATFAQDRSENLAEFLRGFVYYSIILPSELEIVSVAQLVEQLTLNQRVRSSSLRGDTDKKALRRLNF